MPQVLGLAITAAAVLRKGSFFYPDSILFPGLLILAAGLNTKSAARTGKLLRTLAPLVLLSAWWALAAIGWGELTMALPLLGGLVAFGAAFATGWGVGTEAKNQIARTLTFLALAVAALGLIGVVWHIEPLAMPAQGLYRLAGPITYSNAAGIFLAMMVPVAIAIPLKSQRLTSAVTYLLFTGMLASLSRGALVAFLIGLIFMGRANLRALVLPGVMGLAAGVAVAAGAGLSGNELLVGGAIVGGLGLVVAAESTNVRKVVPWLATGLLIVGVVVIAIGGLRTTLSRRTSAVSVDARFAEWKAAFEEFRTHPLVGSGPEHKLVLVRPGGLEVARFAHNEYLQVAASSGTIGVVLLGATLASLFVTLRMKTHHREGLERAAISGVIMFAVGGVFDFAWHLPGLMAAAGWLAVMSMKSPVNSSPPKSSPEKDKSSWLP